MSEVIETGAAALTSEATPVSTAPAIDTTVAQQSTGAWYESIQNPDLRGYAENAGFKGVDDLVTEYKNAKTLLGDKVNATIIPGEDATPEQLSEFYNKLGRPDKPEDYKLPVPEGADAKFSTEASKWMHELGLNSKQAQTLASKMNEYTAGYEAQQAQQRAVQAESDLKGLKQEWQQSYEKNIELARRAARGFGMDADRLTKIENALGTKDMLKFFSDIGNGFSEHKFEGSGGPSPFGMTKEAAKVKMDELKSDRGFGQKLISGDSTARAEWDRLNKIMVG